jgi:hypothetical protein
MGRPLPIDLALKVKGVDRGARIGCHAVEVSEGRCLRDRVGPESAPIEQWIAHRRQRVHGASTGSWQAGRKRLRAGRSGACDKAA